MTIINGTFAEDLEGWTYSNGSLDNGRARLWNYRCQTAYIYQRFLIDDDTLSFDWQVDTPGLPFNDAFYYHWTLTVHDPILGNQLIFTEDLPFNGSGIRYFDVSQYIGKEATINFYRTIRTYCEFNDDQGNTLWLDNVILSANWGTLRISSIPGNADIYIDDQFINITPETGYIDLTNISPGTHTITIKKIDYYDYEETITINPGRIYEISAELEPKTACIAFYSDPSGAKIFLSDRNGETSSDTGFTTFKEICDLFWGDYKWKLIKSGYYPEYGIANITGPEDVSIVRTLTQIGIGCIYFESDPPGAKIFLDGNDTDLTTPDTVCDLSLGPHQYELRLIGYETVSGNITLVSTEGGYVSESLIPITISGNISFISDPTFAEIWIDGIKQLDENSQPILTPATITDIPVGVRTITLKKDRFIDYITEAEVLEDQTISIEATLVPEIGCIYFKSTPEGASIIVDDNDTGLVTPNIICDLDPGLHIYKLVLEGYPEVEGTAELPLEQGITIYRDLKPTGAGAGIAILGLAMLGVILLSKEI